MRVRRIEASSTMCVCYLFVIILPLGVSVCVYVYAGGTQGYFCPEILGASCGCVCDKGCGCVCVRGDVVTWTADTWTLGCVLYFQMYGESVKEAHIHKHTYTDPNLAVLEPLLQSLL